MERANIHKYYPNAKSVISVAINYFTGHAEDYFKNHKISKQNAIDFMKENFEVAII